MANGGLTMNKTTKFEKKLDKLSKLQGEAKLAFFISASHENDRLITVSNKFNLTNRE